MKPILFCALQLLFVQHSLSAQCQYGKIANAPNLIVNGDFSQGKTKFSSDYTLSPTLYAEGTYNVGLSAKNFHTEFSSCPQIDGQFGPMLIVNASWQLNAIVWQQTIEVEKGKSYVFSCNAASVVAASPAVLSFYADDEELDVPFHVRRTTCDWATFSVSWTAPKSGTIHLSIVNKNRERGGNDFALDDISFYECAPAKKEQAKKGELLQVENIHFETSKAVLQAESFKNLKELAAYLKKYPKLRLEISGHTDLIGKADANKTLSEERAQAVVDFLVEQGVERERLISKGFGSEKPLYPKASTPAERQKNRRVEFRVL